MANGVKPRITEYPAGVVDIFPTLVDLLGLPEESMGSLMDGVSLVPLFKKELGRREKPLPFQSGDTTVLIDNDDKIMFNRKRQKYELYNLKNDPAETTNVLDKKPEIAARLKTKVTALAESIAKSDKGLDYPGKKITGYDPGRMFWAESPAYEPYLDELFSRPEYKGQMGKTQKKKSGGE